MKTGPSVANRSDISGHVRVDVHGRLSKVLYAEAALGCLGVFQHGVDAVDGGPYLAWRF
ncbi:hypothetical protein ACRDNQ_10990 [Palleronia sp. KMU-117]|uniref:hypothetical protein n=1 Tax=Palleronia sp. KMU-117 TaxID=3434108 RepID=UPI003D74F0D3